MVYYISTVSRVLHDRTVRRQRRQRIISLFISVAFALTTPSGVEQVIEVPVLLPTPQEEEKIETAVDSSVLCNCVRYVKEKYHPNLPPMISVVDNLSQTIGDVAVFYYPRSGLYHYAKVTWHDGYSYTIDEANYHTCQRSERTLTLDYPSLIGFYHL